MTKYYVIHWRNKLNGRSGVGTTRFDREEAEMLAEELNRDYPNIEHRPLDSEETVVPIPAAAAS